MGKLYYWVANWNLARAQAARLLGGDVVDVVDCTGGDVDKVHAAFPRIRVFAGYVTGGESVRWTPDEWDLIRTLRTDTGERAALIRIDQSNSDLPLVSDVHYAKDVETGAAAIPTAVTVARERLRAGRDDCIYIEQGDLAELEAAVEAAGLPPGEIVAYQWGSPLHTPATPLPGTSLTIGEANCDLSVARADWIPLPDSPRPLAGDQRYAQVSVFGRTITLTQAPDGVIRIMSAT